MNELDLLQRLAVALLAGLLIGLERGWATRAAAEGARIAGIRTFGLIGLLGALTALLAQGAGAVVLALGFLAFGVLLAASYWLQGERGHDFGITTEVAALITFALGALAMAGHLTAAASVAVVTAVILSLKPRLHGLVAQLRPEEVYGTLKLLLISVVLLPILPDRGFGPWQALNPFELWLLVVLIAAISFVGYAAVRIAGARRGLLLTALCGGLIASTVVALDFARLARKHRDLQRILAAGVAAASATMFPRMLVVVAAVQPGLLPGLLAPLGVMMAIGYGAALWWSRTDTREAVPEMDAPANPFELGPALKFGLLLAVITLLANALRHMFGDEGIYALAALSGIADVDAITLSLAGMTARDLAVAVAVHGIVIAAMVNTLAKAALVVAIGRGRAGRRVAAVAIAQVFAGGAAMLAWP
jgi:uncharacterized membrane protein (DUF4010 family)